MFLDMVRSCEVKNKSFFGMVDAFAFILEDWCVLRTAALAIMDECGGIVS